MGGAFAQPGAPCEFQYGCSAAGLLSLSVELYELMREAGKEQNVLLRFGMPTLDESRAAVPQLYTPAA